MASPPLFKRRWIWASSLSRLVIKEMYFPSGDQMPPPSPSFPFVIWSTFVPSAFIRQMWEMVRFLFQLASLWVKRSWLLSGESRRLYILLTLIASTKVMGFFSAARRETLEIKRTVKKARSAWDAMFFLMVTSSNRIYPKSSFGSTPKFFGLILGIGSSLIWLPAVVILSAGGEEQGNLFFK